MTFVRVEQRHAHLAGPVRLYTREGRDGPIAKATLTAISNIRRRRRGGRGGGGEEIGDGHPREEEATAIQWTLWGPQAEQAVLYLGKGSHINVVGRVQNSQYKKDGQTVYTLTFTAETINYLDTKAEGEARRLRLGSAAEEGVIAPRGKSAARARAAQPASRHQATDPAPAAEETDDIPF